MDKPHMLQQPMAYDYHQCRDYLLQERGIDIENFSGCTFEVGSDNTLQSLWHWIVDTKEIHNGCYFAISTQDIFDEDAEEPEWARAPQWVKDILTIFKKEFEEPEDGYYFWVEW